MAVARLKAGVAEIDITPQPGPVLAGELESRVSTGISTPLMAKALALSDGQTTLALVTLDLFGLQREAADLLIQRIALEAGGGLRPEALMVVCSHTREGPSTPHGGTPPPRRRVRQAGPSGATTPVVGQAQVAGKYTRFVESCNGEYTREVAAKAADAVGLALAMLEDASLGLGYAVLPHLIFNHRLMTRNRKAITAWMGVPRDEVLEPEGPIDPQFSVFVVRDGRGHPVCLLWSFAADLRYDSGNPLHDSTNRVYFPAGENAAHISAGLPYYVQQAVDERIGRHVPSLYLSGCGGDVSFTHGLERSADAVASAVMAVQLETPCDPVIRLGCARERVILPIRDYSQFWSRHDIELKYPQAVEAFAREVTLLQAQGAHAVPAAVQAFRLGRFALVGLPGLAFAGLALDIKGSSPAKGTVVAGNLDGQAGYLLPRAAFDHGGFEAWPSRSSPVGAGGAEFVSEVANSLLRGLWRG